MSHFVVVVVETIHPTPPVNPVLHKRNRKGSMTLLSRNLGGWCHMNVQCPAIFLSEFLPLEILSKTKRSTYKRERERIGKLGIVHKGVILQRRGSRGRGLGRQRGWGVVKMMAFVWGNDVGREREGSKSPDSRLALNLYTPSDY